MKFGDYCVFIVWEKTDDVKRLTIAEGTYLFEDGAYTYIEFHGQKSKVIKEHAFPNYYDALEYITRFFFGILIETRKRAEEQK